jgi:anti-sigma factor RsiW
MTCREFVEFLMAYLDDELDPEVHRVFAEHLDECPPCGDYLDNYRETIRLGKTACDPERPDALPGEVPEGLVQAILAARDRGQDPS